MGLLLVDAWICCCRQPEPVLKGRILRGKQPPHLDLLSARKEMTLTGLRIGAIDKELSHFGQSAGGVGPQVA